MLVQSHLGCIHGSAIPFPVCVYGWAAIVHISRDFPQTLALRENMPKYQVVFGQSVTICRNPKTKRNKKLTYTKSFSDDLYSSHRFWSTLHHFHMINSHTSIILPMVALFWSATTAAAAAAKQPQSKPEAGHKGLRITNLSFPRLFSAICFCSPFPRAYLALE